METYYDTLGVPQTASKEVIRKAYLKLAQDFHPDKLQNIPPAVRKLAEEKFKDVQEAYEVLTKHRAEYDEQLLAVSTSRVVTAPYQAATPPPPPSPSHSMICIVCHRSVVGQQYVFRGVLGKGGGWVHTACLASAASAPPRPHAPAAAAPHSRPAPPPSTSRSPTAKRNIWYVCGKICGELPWQAWVVFGFVFIFVVAATLTSSNTPETPTKAPMEGTQQTVQSVGEQFAGTVHNKSVNKSAEFGIVAHDAAGILSGCMAVKAPLFGSGPLSGRATGPGVTFAVTSAIGKITFVGQRHDNFITGTYTVENENRPAEYGTFTLNKVKTDVTGRDSDKQNCPMDAEVHEQKVPINSTIANDIPTSTGSKVMEPPIGNFVPLTGRVDVYYADDWEKVNSSCLLPAGSSLGLSVRMICGNISGYHSNWDRTPHFTARILLNNAARQRLNSATSANMYLSCENELEANGDLQCKANAAGTIGDVAVYYTDDWEKVNSSCSLLTDTSSHAPLLMNCGDASGLSSWNKAPHFMARIILDDDAMQDFTSSTVFALHFCCAKKLEANGDLHCTGKLKDTVVVAVPAPKSAPPAAPLGTAPRRTRPLELARP